MAQRTREQMKQEHQKLVAQISEWNGNRLDLFELSLPNEELEFHGVMRFFHQDEGAKVSTKCIRVSSTATTLDVLNILVEKFRPDMRMLSLPEYSLYEVHVNGEERKLQDVERPLFVQLNWGKDDREGRFLLKSDQVKTNLGNFNYGQDISQASEAPVPFKRKLSKREKKELKKQEKLAKIKGKENTPGKDSVAEKLYNELPETSFTRSISNPEAVMRRRRQLKLEKKLQQFQDGGPDSGGTLKIYGESLRPDLPYKTLLLSTTDTAAYIVKETLDKYGLEKENPGNFCLVQTQVPPNGREVDGRAWGKEEVLDDYDCPLAILMQHPPSKGSYYRHGTIVFHLRRRTADMPKRKKKKGQRIDDMDEMGYPHDPAQLPYLTELNPDGSELYKGRHHRLPLKITEVGSDRGMSASQQYLQLYGPDIHPRHCVIAHTDGVVTVTPTSRDAETYVGGHRCFETTMLQHGVIVRFGKGNIFRFINPVVEEQMRPPRAMDPLQQQPGAPGSPFNRGGAGEPMQTNNFETTFDVDGHVETKDGPGGPGGDARRGSPGYQPDLMLPATLEFREDGEDAFLATVVSEVNGAAVQFKLAPVYTLYMASRYRISKLYRPDISPQERAHRLTALMRKVAHMIQQTVQENGDQAGALSFWMANASELLHFLKQDLDISRFTVDAQDILAEAVQVAFRYLISCIQLELRNTMPSFLVDTDEDINDEGDVLQVLSSTMSLLRKCRVNAALTIQLFSQLFHYINMWLFNRLVLEPHLQLCTRHWGHRLRRRLNKIEQWAEKQGLELAANCHLARIIQAAHLLEAPKSGPDHIASISSTCFKLNSLQLRALLQNYRSGPQEPTIPQDLIDSVVKVAENTADELTRSDGRDVQLEEEPDLQLPFLLPEDGYSCDILRGVPAGLAEFLHPLSLPGLCRLTMHGAGPWTVYMANTEEENLRSMQLGGEGGPTPGLPQEPEDLVVTFAKVHGSMGLSIVAAKGEGQDKRGIYIKSVVPGGAAALDGRLTAGDQLIEVDGRSLVGLTQEKAAQMMTQTGQQVTLRVAKQGAIYHGLATLLSQPSPIMQRAGAAGAPGPGGGGSPARRPPGPGGPKVPPGPGGPPRPKSEDVSRFAESPAPGSLSGFPGQQGMYGARSSPALTGARSHDNLQRGAAVGDDPYASFRGGPGGPPPPHGHGPHPGAPPPSAPPHSNVPQSASYYNMTPQDREREQNLRSKSTSQLDRHDPHDAQPPYRQAISTSTLPHNYAPHSAGPPPPHHGGPPPGPQGGPPQALQHKFPSQPDLQHRPPGAYENYPGAPPHPQQQRPDDPYARERYEQPHYMNHTELRNQFNKEQQDMMRGTQSMGNLRGEPEPAQRPDMLNLQRPKSEEFDRVHEWQQRNEMEQRRLQQQQQQQQQPGGPGPYGPQGYGAPQGPGAPGYPSSPAGEPQRPPPPQDPHHGPYYTGGPPAPGRRDTTPPYAGDIRGRPAGEMDQGPPQQRPEAVPKPHVAPKPGAPNRQSQMYDPRNQPQGGYPGYGPPPASQQPQHIPPSPSQPTYSAPQPPRHDNHPVYSRPDRQQHPMQQQQQQPGAPGYGRRNQSPVTPGGEDLPPPPPDVPPPPLGDPDRDRPPDELPPPPPVSVNPDYERQIQEEQTRMMKRMAGTGADRPSGPGGDDYDPRYKGYQGDRPPQPQHYPSVPPQKTVATHFNQPGGGPQQPQGNFANYQNMGPGGPGSAGPRGPLDSSSQQQQKPPYPYAPRHQEPAVDKKPPVTTPTRPPVAQKPRFVIKPSDLQKPGSSPWEREQKEHEQHRRAEESRLRIEAEVNELERKPYLTPEEQDRLSKLRLEQEFQRRVQEAAGKDEDDDSDTDITDRASGRAKMIGMIREDLERTRQSLVADRSQRERELDQGEAEKAERQERRIQMFEKEREEQRQREYRRQEKRERDTEEYLKKQRELRDQARRQQEESLRQQRLDDEKRREREREELRKRREREREQMREMQAAREEEERVLRDQARRAEEDAARQRQQERERERERERAEEQRRREKYGHLGYNDPAYTRGSPGEPPNYRPPGVPTQEPPYARGPGDYPPRQPPAGYNAPAPPERNSSYDVGGYRPTNSNAEANNHLNGPPSSRSTSATGFRPGPGGPSPPGSQEPLGPYGAKKSVSFDSNLTTEIQTHPYPSTSSEGSLGFHPNAGPPGGEGPLSPPGTTAPNAGSGSGGPPPNYIFTRGSSSGGSSVSDPPPPLTQPPTTSSYFQRGNSSPYTPTTPNEVFDQSYRTPESQLMNNQTLVVSSTPGVVGAQEVYRDPRDRIARQKAVERGGPAPAAAVPERMSFRDKMKMFATEIGENTPTERPKISKAQREIETNLNGR